MGDDAFTIKTAQSKLPPNVGYLVYRRGRDGRWIRDAGGMFRPLWEGETLAFVRAKPGQRADCYGTEYEG